jgi:dynein heavy chain
MAVQAEQVGRQQEDCAHDLEKAEPAILAAEAALNTLNKANLTELKALPKPPSDVITVLSAVLYLNAPKGAVPKVRSWW